MQLLSSLSSAFSSLVAMSRGGRGALGAVGVSLAALLFLSVAVTGRPTMDRTVVEENVTITITDTYPPPPTLCRSRTELVSVEQVSRQCLD